MKFHYRMINMKN